MVRRALFPIAVVVAALAIIMVAQPWVDAQGGSNQGAPRPPRPDGAMPGPGGISGPGGVSGPGGAPSAPGGAPVAPGRMPVAPGGVPAAEGVAAPAEPAAPAADFLTVSLDADLFMGRLGREGGWLDHLLTAAAEAHNQAEDYELQALNSSPGPDAEFMSLGAHFRNRAIWLADCIGWATTDQDFKKQIQRYIVDSRTKMTLDYEWIHWQRRAGVGETVQVAAITDTITQGLRERMRAHFW